MKRKFKSITMIKDAAKDILIVAVAEDGTAWARWWISDVTEPDFDMPWHALPELPETPPVSP